jgi:D-serine deaminase-like pyridoxal phosphate-dependent protein
MLYGMPVSANKLADLSTLWEDMVKASEKATLHILVDHLDQLDAVAQFEASKENPRRWTIFVKVDAGYKCVHRRSQIA